METLSPKALLSLVFNGAKAVDVVSTALKIGLLDALEHGPVTVGELAARFELIPHRLHKLLDCLASLGLVARQQDEDDPLTAEYRAVPGLADSAVEVLGADSPERDRDRYPWRALHGRLLDVLRGGPGIPEDLFGWPPANHAQIVSFEHTMASGIDPIVESFHRHTEKLWTHPGGWRILDVGGGDGTLGACLLHRVPGLLVDVYNLPGVKSLVDRTRAERGCGRRLGFVSGDFLAEPLPTGYNTLAFVRILHNWPPEVARGLIDKAYAALDRGGQLLICEEFRTAERLATQFFWNYFLIGVDGCASLLRDVDWYTNSLKAAGFADIEILPGPFEIVVATKP